MHFLEPSQQMIFKYIFKYNRGWRLLYQQLWDYVASFSVATSNYLPLPWPPANVKGLHSRGRVLCKMSVGKRKGDPVGQWRPSVCGVNYLCFAGQENLHLKAYGLWCYFSSLCAAPDTVYFLVLVAIFCPAYVRLLLSKAPLYFLQLKKINICRGKTHLNQTSIVLKRIDWYIQKGREQSQPDLRLTLLVEFFGDVETNAC